MSSIEELSISSLGQRLQRVFKLDSPPLECSTEDRILLAQKRSIQAGKDLNYPILAYSLSEMAPEDYAAQTPRAFSSLQLSTNQDFASRMRLYPHAFSFDVSYLDNSRTRLLMFLSAWGRAAAEGNLNFRLLIQGNPIDVQVKPDKSISVPKRDVNIDSTSQYEFQGRLVMSTYLSGPFETSILKIARIKETTIGFVDATFPVSPNVLRGTQGRIPTIEQIEASITDYDQSYRDRNLMFEIVLGDNPNV